MKQVRFSHKQLYRRQNYGGVSEREKYTHVRAALRFCSGSVFAVCDSVIDRAGMIVLIDHESTFTDFILGCCLAWAGWMRRWSQAWRSLWNCMLAEAFAVFSLLAFSLYPFFFQRQVVLPWKCISRKKTCSYFPLRWTIYFSSVCLKLLLNDLYHVTRLMWIFCNFCNRI